MKLLQTLTIHQFPLKCKIANKQRPKYWKKSHKNRPKKLEGITKTDSRGFLLDAEGNRIIKNSKSVGNPRYVSLSGNGFTTGLHPSIRSFVVKYLKGFYMPFVRQLTPFQEFPLIVEWDFYSPVETPFDMSNFWFYYKYFEDCLFMDNWEGKPVTPIIPDDNRKYVTKPGAPLLFPVEDINDRKFEFRFYLDEREIIKQHPLWNTN